MAYMNNMKIQCSDEFVVQTRGDPDGDTDGYICWDAEQVIGCWCWTIIPCEIFLLGDKAPLYEMTVEDGREKNTT
jgi:hypothetical protein